MDKALETVTRVLVIRNAYDKDMGGAEQYALNLSIVLKEEGFTPLLMTRVPNLIEKAKASDISTITGHWHSSQEWGKHYFLRLPLMIAWYIYIILRYRVDIIHPQGRDDFIFASIAAGILGKKVVWTDHADLKYILNLSVHPFPHLRNWVIYASRYASTIICVSNSEKEKITANAPGRLSSKLQVIHNGVFKHKEIPALKRPKGTLIIANSRLVPDKGISELLKAMSKLKSSTTLWIIGSLSGNKEIYTEMASKLGIIDRVKFLGYVNNPNQYVNSADIFVHPSYHEAFSLAVIEAAMLGKPIVATSVGGTPEIISEACGLLVPPKNEKALYEALVYLIDNPAEAKKFGENAKKRASSEFDFTKIVTEKVIPIYRS